MTYQSVWWHPNYTEYAAGVKDQKTWPQVTEQYRRPHALNDLRYYDLPEERYQAKLYYNVNLPRLGQPQYRATFRDKPHTVSRHYPEGNPEGRPLDFYGRVYYEDGPPQFKYEGPKRDKLYWLERSPYLPDVFTKPTKQQTGGAEADGQAGTPGSRAGSAYRKDPIRSKPSIPCKEVCTYPAYYTSSGPGVTMSTIRK